MPTPYTVLSCKAWPLCMPDMSLQHRWDMAGSSHGKQQQQQQHPSKAPGGLKQLPPPQQPSSNGAAHMQGIFSSGLPPPSSI